MSVFESACLVSEYSYHISGLRTAKLHRHCQKYFYSMDVMEAARCICNSILYSTHLSSKDRFREYIKSEISNLSTSEYSSSMVKHSSDGVFIIKSCTDDSCNIKDEAYLCLTYLNNLRRCTPFFRYCFDYINCSPILSNSNKVSVCPTDGTGYGIFEIVEGITMETFLEMCTFEEFMKVFIIVCLSLRMTKNIELTLYNCITDNIMIRMLDEELMFIFNIDGKPIQISSSFIPVIMNYDKARYLNSNKEVIYADNEEYSEFYDINSYLTSCIIFLNQKESDIPKKLSSVRKCLSGTFDNLIKTCFKCVGRMTVGRLPLYNKRTSEELNELGMSTYGSDLSFLEYYDLLSHSPEDARKNFNLELAFIKEQEFIESLKEELKFKIEIEKIKPSRVTSYNYFILFKKRLICFLMYLNAFHRLKLHHKIGVELTNSEYYDHIQELIQEHREWINLMKERVNEVQLTLEDIETQFEWYSYGIQLVKLAIENEEI